MDHGPFVISWPRNLDFELRSTNQNRCRLSKFDIPLRHLWIATFGVVDLLMQPAKGLARATTSAAMKDSDEGAKVARGRPGKRIV